MLNIEIPTTQNKLIQNARAIAGLSLKELAAQLDTSLPDNLLHGKGLIGQLIETALGATAGSQAKHDFEHLGIELKTIPVTANGQAKESTYVCTVPLQPEPFSQWETSWVRNKLRHVLWVPLQADSQISIEERRIGQAILAAMTDEDETILKNDWLEHMEKISLGRIDEISAHQGEYLQIRPKAANRDARTTTSDADGNTTTTLPRGFYLRTKYTNKILQQA